jgi:hypothetical protein
MRVAAVDEANDGADEKMYPRWYRFWNMIAEEVWELGQGWGEKHE